MDLGAKVDALSAVVGVIGLGYVGLPLAAAFHRAGFPVLGFDVDPVKIELLRRGENYLKHLGTSLVSDMRKAGRFDATADFSRLGEADAVISCVPTPLGRHLEPDLSFVEKTADDIAKTLRPQQLVVLESTTYPRTTREVMLPRLEAGGLKCGKDFYLAYSPEREDPGRRDHNTQTIPKLVGGIDPASGEVAVSLYRKAIRHVIPVSTAEVAEAAKLLENIYRAVNIAMVNEMKMILTEMGIDVWEVIKAASTKPFGFQAFYPGPGLGGHCLAGHEIVCVRPRSGAGLGHGNGMAPPAARVVPLAELYADRAADGSYEFGDVEATACEGFEALSVDLRTGKPCFAPVTHLFRRPSPTPLLRLRVRGNRLLTVTDGHPMLVHENGEGIVVRRAGELRVGDSLVLMSGWPSEPEGRDRSDRVDLIEVARHHGSCVKIRVMPKAGRWDNYDPIVRPVLRRMGASAKDAYRHNTVPLAAFLELERAGTAPFGRDQVLLSTGNGRSRNLLPAGLALDEDFARLIGYYLSEGCLTVNPGLRVRFCFGSHEAELIDDMTGILDRLGIRNSVHRLSTSATTHVKVSSALFGLLLRDELGCGVRSEDARVPDRLMSAPEAVRRALLSGLFRGDGDVHLASREREYRKRGRTYRHRLHAATVGYFTCSPLLLQQVTLLLHGLGMVPQFHRSKPHLRLCGAQAEAMEPLLVGAKQEKLAAYRAGRVRPTAARSFALHGEEAADEAGAARYATADVLAIEPIPPGPVYSIEVDGTHTFVTSYGIAVHNCIPIDPFYLTWKAREVGMPTRFIELAGEVNHAMPDYVVRRTALALNERGKPVKGSRVLVLGLAYKPDVDDVRESPSLELIEKLEGLGALVDYNDPHVPATHKMRRYDLKMESVPLTPQSLGGYDCVLIATHHAAYDWQMIAEHASLIVDTRNATRDVKGSREHIVMA